MNLTRVLSTVEVHTAGEPFRIVTSGLPKIHGRSIVERRAWLKDHADHLRRALMLEPRGHADMYGGYLTDAVSEDADFGIIFIHNEGYSDHCGHGVIGLATAAVALGWVERTQPETRVGIDAPCGFIEAFVKWDGEHAGSVRFVNVPSFIWQRDAGVDTPSFGTVRGDICFGGAFYFYTSGEPFGLEIREAQVDRLIQFGDEVKRAANAAFKVQHPTFPRSITSTARSSTTRRATPVPHRPTAACSPIAKSTARRRVLARPDAWPSYICADSWPQVTRSSTSRSSARSFADVCCPRRSSTGSMP